MRRYWSGYFLFIIFLITPAYAAETVVSSDYLSSQMEKAALGDSVAQFNLGVLYHNGQGVPQDNKKSAEWLRKSADQDNADAEVNLFLLYRDGQGVPQDDKQAAMWCQRAAEQKNVSAEFFLSQLYKTGKGVTQDDKLATRWLVRAVMNSGQAHVTDETPKNSKLSILKAVSGVLSLAVIFAILVWAAFAF